MKLNLSALELLALHNLLYGKFDGPCAHDEVMWKDSDPRGREQAALHIVYNRIKACILNSLNGNKPLDDDNFRKWLAQEEARIEDLVEKNEDVKKEFADLVKNDKDFMTLEDEEIDEVVPQYPRKSPPPARGPGHKGKWNGPKR